MKYIFTISLIILFSYSHIFIFSNLLKAQSITPEAVSTSRNILPSGHSEEGYEKSMEVQEKISTLDIWIPTDYINDDILSNIYTVQQGDTLWEIAEGFYGDPLRWTEILNKNSGKIGFLPNGEQSLIEVGQLLEL